MQSFREIDGTDSVEIRNGPDEKNTAQDALSQYLLTSESGSMATEWSVIVLTLTAVIQFVVVSLSGSMALLGDSIHNFSDALSALPLWLAFFLQKLQPDKRYSHGFGRFEDLAGIFIVASIIISGLIVGFESVLRLIHPEKVQHLPAVLGAAFVGFLGNEAVALFRLKIGREIGSAALIADGYHARLDGLTSLSVIAGCAGIWMGFPQTDSIVGLFMAVLTLWAGWELAGTIVKRLVDEVDPQLLAAISETALKQAGVKGVESVKARFSGHRLRVEMVVSVDGERSVESAQKTCDNLRAGLIKAMPVIEHMAIELAADDS
ncbi:MAG: cation transporter [Candidatus Melainabacteria bacterium]|nr:MAG: cation transporter [Candidatus Melainabacteria bacterium]